MSEKMSRADRVIGLGLLIVPYWIVFYLFVFSDWYLELPLPALILKVLLAPALITNLSGLFFGFRLTRAGTAKKTVSLLVHLIPLLAAGGFFAWLFFGVKL